VTTATATSESLLALLNTRFKKHIVESKVDLGDAVIRIHREGMSEFFQALKIESDFRFDLLLSVTAVDWLDSRDDRFEVVYHLMSVPLRWRLRVKIDVPEEKAEVDSLVPIWKSANFMEREAWDMFGINFKGHPDQRRILMYDEFVGHPLRKDYPIQGKQPRVRLIHPEVRNTAVDMKRPALVQINRRREAPAAGNGHAEHNSPAR
jgi:NADH-quinone oxidoreductase subunit C